MKYKIGNKVIFKSQPYKEYAWKLNDFEEYTISNRAFDINKTFDIKSIKNYYEVADKNGNKTCWFEEDDFLTLREYRKLKIKKINKNLWVEYSE